MGGPSSNGGQPQPPQSGMFKIHPSSITGIKNNGVNVPRYTGRGGMYEGIEFGNRGGQGSQRGSQGSQRGMNSGMGGPQNQY